MKLGLLRVARWRGLGGALGVGMTHVACFGFQRQDLKIRPGSTIPASYVLACSMGLENPPRPEEYTRLYDVRRGSAILGSVYAHRIE